MKREGAYMKGKRMLKEINKNVGAVFLLLLKQIILHQEQSHRDCPKVCVNLQTDVR